MNRFFETMARVHLALLWLCAVVMSLVIMAALAFGGFLIFLKFLTLIF